MLTNLWNWIVSVWWFTIIIGGISFGSVSYLFNKIIGKEMERGGEEYAERAITQIQKWAAIILIISISLVASVIVFKILDVFGLIQIGR